MKTEIAKRIVHVRKSNDMTQTEFAERLNATRPKIAAYELAKVNFDPSFLALICKEFHINENWLLTGKGNIKVKEPESIFEQLKEEFKLDCFDVHLVREYTKLVPEQRRVIKNLFENSISAYQKEATKNSGDRSVSTEKDSKKSQHIKKATVIGKLSADNCRQLPLYEYPASAGLGVFAGEGEYELVNVSDDVPMSANFGVRIKGDSMTPKILNGAIAWIRQQSDVDYGDMCLVIINEEGFCKVKTKEGFKSLNIKYKTIKPHEYDSCRISGKVVYVENPE